MTKKRSWQWTRRRYGLTLKDGRIHLQDIAPFSKPLNRYSEAIVIRTLIKEGAPEIGAHLLDCLDYESKKLFRRNDVDKLECIIEGIGLYRVNEGLEHLRLIYSKADSSKWINERILRAIVIINDSSQVPFLLECLKDEDIDRRIRSEIAGALTVYDKNESRIFLLEQYKLYLNDISTKSRWDGTVRYVLEHVYDLKLIEMIGMLKNKKYSNGAMNNISTLITRMKINNLSVDKLLEMARDNDFSGQRHQRFPAIYCLGKKAGPEVIPILQKLKPWINCPSHAGGDINNAAKNAIKDIKRRHWRTLSQK